VSSGKLVPITRDFVLYLEPSSHAVKRKNREAGSEFGRYGNRRACQQRLGIFVVSEPVGVPRNRDDGSGMGLGTIALVENLQVRGSLLSIPETTVC